MRVWRGGMVTDGPVTVAPVSNSVRPATPSLVTVFSVSLRLIATYTASPSVIRLNAQTSAFEELRGILAELGEEVDA